MENNQFKKMLFENQKSFDQQFKGIKPLNEAETNFKPKLSAKKQLAEYKTVNLNGDNYALIREIGPTHKDDYLVKFQNGYDLKTTISDLFEDNKIGANWWSVDINKNEPYENTPEVSYLLENFDALMK